MTTRVRRPGMHRDVQVAILRVAHAREPLDRRSITRQIPGVDTRDTDRAVHLLALHGAVILREGRLAITEVGLMLLRNYDSGFAIPDASRETRRRQVILARRLVQRS
jgi:hypothetical protein